MPRRDEAPPDLIKVMFTRPSGNRAWVWVPAADPATAKRLIAPLLRTVPDDAVWTTTPHTPGLLPADKEAQTT